MSRRPFWYLRRRTVDADVEEELRGHLQRQIDELVRRGVAPDEARREAIRRFGDLEATRRYCRRQDEAREQDTQRTLFLQDFVQDLRIGLRTLWRSPALTLTIVATVGVGLGATTAIFGAVSAVLLRPLPYAAPADLVRIYTDTPPFKFRFSTVDYLAFSEQQTHFTSHATYTDRAVTFADGDRADLLRARVVSWQFFSVLGLRPLHGRDFTAADSVPGRARVAIASHDFWQQRLGGRADAVGHVVRLDGAEHLLIGVLPPAGGPLEQPFDLFLIQQFTPPTRKGPFLYSVVARLSPGADRAQASGELQAINRALFPLWKASYQDEASTWRMEDLKSNLVGDRRLTAALAVTAVALVWLIACVNASSLLIARITSRRAELAVRTALGASRGRIVRSLLAESVWLATGAALVGGVVAWGGIEWLRAAGPAYFPRSHEIRPDLPMLWLVAAMALSSALIFGLLPALQTASPASAPRLGSGRRVTAGGDARRLRRGLVAGQFAIATPLLVIALLLLTSLDRLRQIDLGFDPAPVLSGAIRLPSSLYPDDGRAETFWSELARRVERLPGVAAVAFADGLPPDNVGNFNNFDLEQYPAAPGQSQPVTPWVAVTPAYVATLGLTVIEGRLLDERDAMRMVEQGTLPAVMVDRAWAQRFFPGESAVGKRLREGGCTTCPWTTVVGVVGEVKYAGLDRPADGTVYTPLFGRTARYLVVRTAADPAAVSAALQQTVRAVEPSAPLTNVATMVEMVEQSLARPRSLSLLLAGFAVAALVLSVVGVYGVMNYYVQQHLKEISIRLALGSRPSHVARLIIGQGLAIVACGVAAGLAAAVAAARAMSTLLFGVPPLDPVVYTGAAVLLVLVAGLACALPAAQAMRVPPAGALGTD